MTISDFAASLSGERIVRLSELGRVVDLFASRLQLQERLTAQLASWLEDQLTSALAEDLWADAPE